MLRGNEYEWNYQLISNHNKFYEFDYDNEEKKLKIEECIPSIRNKGNYDCYTLFNGTIKNKSELLTKWCYRKTK